MAEEKITKTGRAEDKNAQINPAEDKCTKTKLAQDVVRLIEESYKEKFSLDYLAGKLYHNKSYLDRTFREVTGYTPLEYHNFVRCQKSRDLLEHSNLSISYISYEVGFVSPAHYSRIFKKIYRCSPMQYRKTLALESSEGRTEAV